MLLFMFLEKNKINDSQRCCRKYISLYTIRSRRYSIFRSRCLRGVDDCGYKDYYFIDSFRNQNQEMALSSTWQSGFVEFRMELFVNNFLFRPRFCLSPSYSTLLNREYQGGDDELCDSMSDVVILLFGFCALSICFFFGFIKESSTP